MHAEIIAIGAEIIAIGDEITSGRLLDTNTQWLSRRLEELGIRVLYHSAVGDELEASAEVFRRAVDRADLVIATGGLGPTADDLAREAIAEATGCPLVVNQQALAHVRKLFARYKRPMPEQNERQASFPAGARMIDNPNGTAPGIDLDVPRDRRRASRIVSLPGVPAEMEEMWHDSVAALLREASGPRRVVRHRQINCFGAGESQIEAMLPDLIRRGRSPRVGINASKATIILRIAAEGATEGECDAAMEPTIATIRRCLGKLVFGEGDDQLQDAVVRLMQEQNKTLATVEWGTAGLLSHWLGDTAEAADCYLGGLVVPSRETLTGLLDVRPELLARHSSVSGEVARAMAVRCRELFGANYTLAVGRLPEFDPSTAELLSESGPRLVYFALATEEEVKIREVPLVGHPAIRKIFLAKRALNMVRLAMLGD